MVQVKKIMLAALFVFVSPLWLYGYDGTVEHIGPQLIFDPPEFLSLEALDISISNKLVTVEYTIKNNSDKDWSSRLVFNIPQRAWYDYIDWYPNRGFSELKVSVNGENLDYERLAISYLNGKDVSQELAAAGLDPNSVDLDENELAERSIKSTPENIRKYKNLKERGLVYMYLDQDKDDIWMEPAWSTANTYFWQQNFPARSLVKIKYTYKPRPGVDGTGAKFGQTLDEPYFVQRSGYKNMGALMGKACASWTDWSMETAGGQRDNCYLKWLTFPLNAIKWSRPVGKLNLTINWLIDDINPVSSSRTMINTCLSGKKVFGIQTVSAMWEKVEINEPLIIMITFFSTL